MADVPKRTDLQSAAALQARRDRIDKFNTNAEPGGTYGAFALWDTTGAARSVPSTLDPIPFDPGTTGEAIADTYEGLGFPWAANREMLEGGYASNGMYTPRPGWYTAFAEIVLTPSGSLTGIGGWLSVAGWAVSPMFRDLESVRNRDDGNVYLSGSMSTIADEGGLIQASLRLNGASAQTLSINAGRMFVVSHP